MPFSQGSSSSGGGSGAGSEIGYDQITAFVTVASVVEATGTTVIACAAHTFDGSPVLATFMAPAFTPPSTVGGVATLCLFEGATQIGRLCVVENTSVNLVQVPTMAAIRFTPTAGSHTYTVTVFGSSAAGSVSAGAGGTGNNMPAFIRFTKV